LGIQPVFQTSPTGNVFEFIGVPFKLKVEFFFATLLHAKKGPQRQTNLFRHCQNSFYQLLFMFIQYVMKYYMFVKLEVIRHLQQGLHRLGGGRLIIVKYST